MQVCRGQVAARLQDLRISDVTAPEPLARTQLFKHPEGNGEFDINGAIVSQSGGDVTNPHVRFGGGHYDGCYGVVVATFPGSPNRPLVRLLFDAAGLPIPEGVEVDLHKLPNEDAELTAVPEAGVSVEEYARRLASARRD